MTLQTWINDHCEVIDKPMLATKAARQFLTDTDQSTDQATINRTIVELHGMGLLVGKPNKPGTLARLVMK